MPPHVPGVLSLHRALATLSIRARTEDSDLARESLPEEAASAITHGIGAILAIAALVLGVIAAAQAGSAWAVVAASIYGTSLLGLFLVSTLYHAITSPGPKRLFMALDHCAIFLLIAGTYTAVALSLLHGTWQGWVMLGIVWGLAILGITLRLVWLRRRMSSERGPPGPLIARATPPWCAPSAPCRRPGTGRG